MLVYCRNTVPELLTEIRETGELTEELEEKLGRTIQDFKTVYAQKDDE